MSDKLKLSFTSLGELDTNSNRVLLNGSGSRELTNCGDLDGAGAVQTQPGYSKVLTSPMVADYSTGHVVVTNGGYDVTGHSTAWLANAVPGDLFYGPDEKYYIVDMVTSDTALRLRTAYEGDSVTDDGAYHIRSRVWLLAPFYVPGGSSAIPVIQDYTGTGAASGTFSGTEDDTGAGVSMTPSARLTWSGITEKAYDYMHNGGVVAYATKFTVPATTSFNYISWPKYLTHTPDANNLFRITIVNDSAGSPNLVSVITNADTGWDTVYEGENHQYRPLAGTVTLSTSTTYWIVFSIHSSWTNGELVFGGGTATTYGGYTPSATKYQHSDGVWHNAYSGFVSMIFNFHTYPSSGNKTYIAPVIDMGFTAASTAIGTIAISQVGETNPIDWFGVDVYLEAEAAYSYEYHSYYYKNMVPEFYVTGGASQREVLWTVETSANSDMSSSTPVTFGAHVHYSSMDAAANTITLASDPGWLANDRVVYNANGGTTITGLTSGNAYWLVQNTAGVIKLASTRGGSAIDISGSGHVDNYFTLASSTSDSAALSGSGNLKRYYQITYYLTCKGSSGYYFMTPMVTGATITLPMPLSSSFDQGSYQLVGSNKKLFTTIQAGAATISTTEVSPGNEVRPSYYQEKVFWSTGYQKLKYWDGMSAAAALVDDLTQSDGSAGDNPPVRGRCLVLHNDKLILGRDVEKQFATGTSTTLDDDDLIDTTATFTSSGVVAGMLLYPDSSAWPRAYWRITAVDDANDKLTCSGATMTSAYGTNSPGYVGDTYLVTMRYSKVAWYTTETEPADWPTGNLLLFGDGDEDRIMRLVSWKGNLYVVCRSQIWKVSGYGPDDPWTKECCSRFGGTLSPHSIVDAADTIYWWTGEGIVSYEGGTTRPTVISEKISSLVEDINEELVDEVTGAYYQGRVYWSWPSADSNINDQTLVYDIADEKWSLRSWGMYCPERFYDSDGIEHLYFWEPTSGCICKLDEGIITLAGSAPAVSFATQYQAGSDPVEVMQPLVVRVTLKADADETINVALAMDYTDNYTGIGELKPVGSEVSGRTTVNATDTQYLCRAPNTVQGASASVRLSFSATAPVEIYTVELIADPFESSTFE